MASEVSSKPDEELVIVLHIDEGISLNAAETLIIEASLSGNKLYTEPVKPGHTTSFDCDLVWETDKKSIKRMKIENLPVKIDCYALRNFKRSVEGATKEHIGYILVSVKNIALVPYPKALQTKPRWKKFIGLSKDWRAHKPELQFSIMITTREFLTADRSELLSQGIDGGDSIVIEENPITCMMSSQKGIFVRLLREEGLLQVGNIDTECDVFIVNILMKNIFYLENIPNSGVDHANPDLSFNYVLLGNPHARPFDKKFNRTYQLHEKVSIKFRSTLASLQEYFKKIFFIPFDVVSGHKVLGSAEIKIDELVSTSDLKDFLEKNPSSEYEMESKCNIKTSQMIQQNVTGPYLELKMVIKYLATKRLHQTEYLDSYKRMQNFDAQGGGDSVRAPKSPSKLKPKPLPDIPEIIIEPDDTTGMKMVGVGQSSSITKPRASDKADIDLILRNTGESSQLPRLFSYNLNLTSLKFSRKPDKGIWQISFFHDKADTQMTFINREISDIDISSDHSVPLDNLELKLFFTSHSNTIMELIQSSELCTLSIKGPRSFNGKAQLDCNNLLIGNKENVTGIVLFKEDSNNVIAMGSVSTNLDDLGVNFNSQLKATSVPIMVEMTPETHRSESNITRTVDDRKFQMHDETFTYKIIEELEEWKTLQQDSFLDDLKKKELTYLDRLKTDWLQQKTKYEEELVSRTDQLATLTKSLQDAQKNIKNKNHLNSRNEQDIRNLRHELETSYNNQLMGIRERARRMEEDLLHEMKLKDIRFDDLERCNEHLKAENCELHQRLECLQAELNKMKFNLIPKSDVETILQEMRVLKEKYEETQKSKFFYKEQWAKAFRECHMVRREQNARTNDDLFNIKSNRLCDLLDDNHSELNIDQQELDQIKHCLNLSDDD